MNIPANNAQFCQYLFGDFLLRSDGVLLHQNKELHIPPKELEVFVMLLKARGKIVTKEEIFDQVWCKNAASDESLTRCIYALRRILREERTTRYIETVYGKGYRFKAQVAIVSKSERTDVTTSIALFPFKTFPLIDESLLHHGLIQGLSKYACFGLNVLPASTTQDCKDFNAINAILLQLKPEFYLTGKVIAQGESWRLFIELVRAKDHRLIDHQSIVYDSEMQISIILAKLISLLVEKLPHLKINTNELTQSVSFDSAISCLNGRREMRRFTPNSLQKALSMFKACINNIETSAQPYCCIAECYLSLAQLGLYDQSVAMVNATNAVNKAIEMDPSNAQALGLLGLLTGIKGEDAVADVLFKQAHLLMPASPDVHYYNALLYFVKGQSRLALKHIECCLEFDSEHTAAAVLKLWLIYYTVSSEQAYILGSNFLQQMNGNNVIIKSMVALFAALGGKQQICKEYINDTILSEDDVCVEINNIYARYLFHGKNVRSEMISFLKRVDLKKAKGNILPLILVAYGRKTMQKYCDELIAENNMWYKIWNQDPRLALINSTIKNGKLHGAAA